MEGILLRVGRWSSWSALLLVLLISADVFMRYALHTSRTWIIDLEWHLFALLFLFGGASTWLKDKHVRVDLFYARWSPKWQALVNITGTLIFLLPWCAMLLYTTTQYAGQSWAIGEGSPDPNGLGMRYIIKMAMVLAFLQLSLAALMRLRTEWRIFRGITQTTR